MRLILLGTGGPRPDPLRQGPATLVTSAAGRHLLFDAGRGVATQLVKAGVEPEEIDAVFLTHHHFDHIGGLGDLLMAAWNRGRSDPLPVYGPPGTVAIVAALFAEIYRADIRFRIREAAVMGEPLTSVATIVSGRDVESGSIDFAEDVRVVVGRVEHGESALGLDDEEWSAVGYRVESAGSVVAISGDAVAGKELARLGAGCDALVMCCYLTGDEIETAETRFLTDHVIAGAPQAAAIAADAGCRRLVLTHLRRKPPEVLEAMVAEIGAVYEGEIIVGEDLLKLEV